MAMNNPGVIPYGKREGEEEELDYSQANVVVPDAYVNEGVESEYNFIAPLDANGLQAPAPVDNVVQPDQRTEAQIAAGAMETERDKYLAQYQQAKADASSSVIQGKDGYQYSAQMTDGDKWTDTLLKGAAALFMTAMPAAGIAAAAMTWMGNTDKQHRQKQIRHLEDKGYKGKDIQAWIDSGDHRFLAEDASHYLNVGGGLVFDTDLGAYVERPGKGGTNSSADYKPYQDENNEWWVKQGFDAQGNEKPPKHLPNYLKDKNGGDGSGTGSYGVEGVPFFENGYWYEMSTDSKGRDVKKRVAAPKDSGVENVDFTRVDTNYGPTWEVDEGVKPDLDDAPDEILKTEGARKHARFIREGSKAEADYRQVTDTNSDGYDATQWAGYLSGKSGWPELLKGEGRRKMEAAQDRFLNAVLRLDTGAAYTILEQYDTKNLFPKPGDTKDIVAQKQSMREEILQGIAQGTGGGRKYAQNTIYKNLSKSGTNRSTPKTSEVDAAKAAAKAKAEALAAQQSGNGTPAQATSGYEAEFPGFTGFGKSGGYLWGKDKNGIPKRLRKLN